MSLNKKVIGWTFWLSGFFGAGFGAFLTLANATGFLQPFGNALVTIYWIVYLGLLGSWYALFDYMQENQRRKR